MVNSVTKALLKEELGLGNSFVVITVGRFIPLKGFDILLNALSLSNSQVCMLFVGGRPTPDYEKYVEKVRSASVRFIDFLDKNELKKYYQAADIFVTATRSDVWGLVVGEAMAAGLPVISSNHCVAGLSLIEDGKNGFIVRDDSFRTYYQYIEQLRKDEAIRKKMGLNNIEKIRKYAIEESAKNDMISFNDFLRMTVDRE